MADNVVGIKFGVAGGKGFFAGSSGALIKEQLEDIASKIELKINIDKTYFKNQLSLLKKELDTTLGKLNINVMANAKPNVQSSGSSGETNNAARQVESYESVTRALDKLYQAKVKALKAPGTGEGAQKQFASVAGAKANREAQDLNVQYERQFEIYKKLEGVDNSRIQKIQQYKALLEQTLTIQSKPVERMASPIDRAKLGTKAASLYTDNGFDKIIARSKEAKKAVDDFAQTVQGSIKLPEGSLTKKRVDELNEEFIQTQGQLKEIGRKTDTVGAKIKTAFDSRFIQRIAQTLLVALGRALHQVFQNVKAIDGAMTDLKITTQATQDQMDTAAKSIAKSAKKIGSSVVDLINSTNIYARLGFSLADSQILAEKTTMYANVSAVGVEEATTNITGIIKAYNIGAEGLEAVLDQLIWVGNNFAISQGEIGEAMNNAASALAANGNTLQEAIGIVTAANASLQNVSKSSTAVRTIAARISSSTAELQELGEDTGNVLATSKLDEQMRGFGVAITGANGELRSTYDILNDLNKGWKDFTDTKKAAIADMLAGTRQQNAFFSIMQNWKDAESVVANAADGVGTLQKTQEIYLNSIEGKTQQLKAAWQEFSATLLDSGIVKFFVDFLSIIAKILNAVFSMGNGFIANGAIIVAALVGSFLLLNKLNATIKTKLIPSFQAFKVQMGVMATGIRGFAQAATLAFSEFISKNGPIYILSLLGMLMSETDVKARATGELIVSLFALVGGGFAILLNGITASIQAFQASNVVGWILTLIGLFAMLIKGIVDMVKANKVSYEDLKKTAEETADAWKKAEDELSAVKDKLTEIQDKIKELNGKEPLSLVDKKQLEYLEQEEANLKSLEAAKQDAAKKAKKRAAASAADALNQYRGEHGRSIDSSLKGELSSVDFEKIGYSKNWARALQGASLEQEKATLSAAIKEYSTLLEGFNFGDSDLADKYLAQLYQMIDALNLKTGNANLTWDRVLADTRFTDDVEKLKELSQTQEITLDKIKAAAPDFLKYLESIGFFSESDASSIDGLIEGVKDLRDELAVKTKISFTDDMEIMQDKYDSLSNALSDIDDSGVISMENISKILDKDAEGYPALLEKYFKYVEGVGYKLADEWVGKSKSDILAQMARDDIQSYVDEVAKAEKILEGMEYSKAKGDLTEAQKILSKTKNKDKGYQDADDNVTKAQKALDEMTKGKEIYQEAVDNLAEAEKALAGMTEKDDGYQKAVENVNKAKKALNELTYNEENYEKALGNTGTTQENLNTKTAEWATILRQQALEEETERLEGLQEALEKQGEKYKELIDIRKDLLSTYKEEVNYQKELAKKTKNVADLQTELALAMLDKSASGQARARELQGKLDSAKDELDEYTLERAISDLTAQLDKDYGAYEKFIQSEVDKLVEAIKNLADTFKIELPPNGSPSPPKVALHHSGGFVGNVVSLKSNEEFAKLLNGELVTTPKQMDAFMKKTLPSFVAHSGGATINNNTPLIEIKCGDIDREVLPELKTIVNEAVAKIEENMIGALKRTGQKNVH